MKLHVLTYCADNNKLSIKDTVDYLDLGKTLDNSILTEITLKAFRYKAGVISLEEFRKGVHGCLVDICDPYQQTIYARSE